MFRTWTIVVIAAIVIAFSLVCFARYAWVQGKIAALSSPTPPLFSEANANLPRKGARARIVLIGDSRIARWPTAKLAEQWEVINRGVGGETTAQLAVRFYSDAIALMPDVILIEAGINDLIAATFLDAVTSRAVIQDTVEVLRRLASQGAVSGAYVLLATVIPPAQPEILRLPVWRESLYTIVREVNEDLRRSPLPQGAVLIDMSLILSSVGDTQILDKYRVDAIHLNMAGYERISAAIMDQVRHLFDTEPTKVN